MSKYTLDYLAQYTAVGFTAKRGNAWTWREGNDNHFEGSVPLEVVERLIGWEPVKVNPFDADMHEIKDYKGDAPVMLVRSDNKHYLGTVSDSYPVTGYRERLLKGVSDLVDTSLNELGIGSVVVLDGGKKAVVQIESPEAIKHSSGESFRPFIGAHSSLDGSWKTSFKEGVTREVCDNTVDIFRHEAGLEYSYKNTKNSGFKLASAREALDLVFNAAERYVATLETMLAREVSAKQFQTFLELLVPTTADSSKIAVTKADNKRDLLSDLYYRDDRVAPYSGTKWGVLQMVNTYEQHIKPLRGETVRLERNIGDFFGGSLTKSDDQAMELLDLVLA